MSGIGLAVVIGLLSVAGVILLYVGWLLVTEVWRDHHPKQTEPPRSFPTSRDLVIDNLRTMYLEGQIESDEFEAGLWRAMTGASTPEQAAEAEAIAAARPERDEVFDLRRAERVHKMLEESGK